MMASVHDQDMQPSGPPPDVLYQQLIYSASTMEAEAMQPQHQPSLPVTVDQLPSMTRARASLPTSYLYIEEALVDEVSIMDMEPSIETIYGVFARKSIPQRTQFGPVEGVILPFAGRPPTSQPNLIVFINETLILDQSDENKSNWMRFVRTASNSEEMNLELVYRDATHPNPNNPNELITTTKFYFMTTKPISQREELKVWYSKEYADRYHLRTLDTTSEVSRQILCNSAVQPQPQELLETHHQSHNPMISAELSGGHKLRSKIAKLNNDALKDSSNRPADHTALLSLRICEPESTNSQKPPPIARPTSYRCETCGKAFPRYYSLRRHQVMHSGEKKYKCSICNMCFSHLYNRNRHMKLHQKAEEPARSGPEVQTIQPSSSLQKEPPASDSPSSNLENVSVSQPTSEGSNEIDSSTTNDGSDASSHQQQTNKTLTNKKQLAPRPYRCQQCYKTFTSDERLAKHLLVHSADEQGKPLACNFCEKRFLNNSALSCHLKIHSVPRDQPRRYDCVLCKELFECQQTRKEHVVSHQDSNGQYHCPSCPKVFDEFPAVRKHIRAFHSDKQYPCTQCEKVFPRPDKLKLHMLRHSDHRAFLCQTCGKQFKRKDKLKEHVQRMHAPDREAKLLAKHQAKQAQAAAANKRFVPKVSPTDYHRFIYKCHSCLLGFKRRGMLVNHLAKRHPDTPPETVPELNLPILKTTRDYYCQYCDKIYKSSSKRKAHILKNHPGQQLPMSNRHKGGVPQVPGGVNPTYSATVGSVTTHPHYCDWCHKQYASKAKLLQHQRKKHPSRVVQGPKQIEQEPVVDDGGKDISGAPQLEQAVVLAQPDAMQIMAAPAPVVEMLHSEQIPTTSTAIAGMQEHVPPQATQEVMMSMQPPVQEVLIDSTSDSINRFDEMQSYAHLTHNQHVQQLHHQQTIVQPHYPATSSELGEMAATHNDAANLITILGNNLSQLNGLILDGDHSMTSAELQQLLQSNPSDLLTQAMAELNKNKPQGQEANMAAINYGTNEEVLWQ